MTQGIHLFVRHMLSFSHRAECLYIKQVTVNTLVKPSRIEKRLALPKYRGERITMYNGETRFLKLRNQRGSL